MWIRVTHVLPQEFKHSTWAHTKKEDNDTTKWLNIVYFYITN